jgi:hypothetical protein
VRFPSVEEVKKAPSQPKKSSKRRGLALAITSSSTIRLKEAQEIDNEPLSDITKTKTKPSAIPSFLMKRDSVVLTYGETGFINPMMRDPSFSNITLGDSSTRSSRSDMDSEFTFNKRAPLGGRVASSRGSSVASSLGSVSESASSIHEYPPINMASARKDSISRKESTSRRDSIDEFMTRPRRSTLKDIEAEYEAEYEQRMASREERRGDRRRSIGEDRRRSSSRRMSDSSRRQSMETLSIDKRSILESREAYATRMELAEVKAQLIKRQENEIKRLVQTSLGKGAKARRQSEAIVNSFSGEGSSIMNIIPRLPRAANLKPIEDDIAVDWSDVLKPKNPVAAYNLRNAMTKEHRIRARDHWKFSIISVKKINKATSLFKPTDAKKHNMRITTSTSFPVSNFGFLLKSFQSKVCGIILTI